MERISGIHLVLWGSLSGSRVGSIRVSLKMPDEPKTHNQALVFSQTRVLGFQVRCVDFITRLSSVLLVCHFLFLSPLYPFLYSVCLADIQRERTENKHTDKHLCTSHASRTAHYCIGIIVTPARAFILRQLKIFFSSLFIMGLSRSIRNQPVNEPPHRQHGLQKK